VKVTDDEINNIFKKFETELKNIPDTSNIAALIQISSDFKDIKEVIQYFESSIDSLKTQNENFKEIVKEIIRDILSLKKRTLEESISRQELDDKLNEILNSLKVEQEPFHKRLKNYLNLIITPKIMVIIISILMFISLLIFKPDIAKDVAHEFAHTFAPIAKKALK